MVLFTTDFSSPVALRLTKSSVFQVVPKTVPYPCYKLYLNSFIFLFQTMPNSPKSLSCTPGCLVKQLLVLIINPMVRLLLRSPAKVEAR